MGQESSTPIDENTPPLVLESRTLDGVAKYVKSGRAQRIVVMTGAGISTSAGIPDFRSPDTGLYANLVRLNLPYAEAVFDISFFRQNPLPFYTLAHELYPGKYRPTIAHSFISLLNDKRRLLKCFTQNIDCLEREAGLPGNMIVEAHGSFAKQRCIECRTEFPDDKMKTHVENSEVPRCIDSKCGGLVKPDIVFFGEQLPEEFFANRALPAQADLCIVMGTSLTVQPFASLPILCSESCPRVLINKEQVGNIGSRPDDVLLLGDCDEGVQKLAEACGWGKELWNKWKTTRPKDAFEMKQPALAKEPTLDAEIEKLTGDIDQSLKLSEQHKERTMSDLQATKSAEEQKEAVKKDVFANDDKAPHIEKQSGGSGGGLAHVFPHSREDASSTGEPDDAASKERDKKL